MSIETNAVEGRRVGSPDRSNEGNAPSKRTTTGASNAPRPVADFGRYTDIVTYLLATPVGFILRQHGLIIPFIRKSWSRSFSPFFTL